MTSTAACTYRTSRSVILIKACATRFPVLPYAIVLPACVLREALLLPAIRMRGTERDYAATVCAVLRWAILVPATRCSRT
eukprot:125660-Rhodomonas_salina.6